MKTLLDYTYHRDPKCFRLGELPTRAYFIPFGRPEQLGEPRENSAFFHSLGGDWRFLWKPSLYDMEDFYKESADLSEFETVSLPETWQAHGKDYIQYQSSPYPFLFDPPNVPEKNPCAAYVKDFKIHPTSGKRYELHIEGKDSCVYVWMNGEFVGYGESPHNDSAFDVTPYLRNGENRICLLVLKWCSGSYLDDQDKIRLSGLFRDIYILERAENGLRDFSIETDVDGKVTLSAEADLPVRAEILDGNRLLASTILGKTMDYLTVENPRLWSAEDPYLYDLVLECGGEYVRHRFGFREVAVIDSVFTVNRKPVKLYGVNRHDSNPETGYVTSPAFMRAELIEMKRYNINAIRTSHYPNDPRFYELCDELGIYVLSEADLECHGCEYVDGWERVTGNPDYENACIDRVARMYGSFKNYTSIVIWSLGNESLWNVNLKAATVYLRNADPHRPLHYEGFARVFEKGVLDEENERFLFAYYDFYSQMYTPLSKMAEIFSDERVTVPFLLCEYSHAMGNSGGDLRFYDDLIQSDPRYTGGFIWEWCDHAMPLTDENGVSFYGYGGDFGEKHHLRNVCMDGVVSPDRKPHSELLEAKAVFAPVRVTRNGDGSLTVRNRHAFSDLSAYDLCWTLTADGKETANGILKVNPPAGQSVMLPCPVSETQNAETAVLTIRMTLKSTTAWANAGHIVAAFSFPLTVTEKIPQGTQTVPPVLTETRTAYTVSGTTPGGKTFAYTFRKDEGTLTDLSVDGEALLLSPLVHKCFRAPTDNDNSLASKTNVQVPWTTDRKFGNLEYTETAVKNFRAKVTDGAVSLTGEFIFGVQGRKYITMGSIEYRIDGAGRITVTENSRVNPELPYFLPRYGLTLTLPSYPTESLHYFGYGPAECYEDKCTHALLGHYEYTPDDPKDAYEYPQESGSHCGTELLTVDLGKVHLSITGSAPFSFSASHYDLHDITKAKHQKDLRKTDRLFLSLDYRMSGVGSASCGGQIPVEECRINASEEFSQKLTICVE